MNRRALPAPPLPRGQRGGVMFWLLVLVVLGVAAVGGALVGYWIFQNVDARLLLRDQPAKVTIPEDLDVTADVLNNLNIRLDDTIRTSVPVDQTVSIPVDDTLDLMAEFDASVPIRMNVDVQDTISVDQTVSVDARIKADVLGDTVELPIRGDIPIQADIPVDLSIPVDKQVRLQFTAPVKAKLKQNLTVPLKTTIDADIPIQADLSVPVTSDLKARVDMPDDPTGIIINYAALNLPLRTLAFGLKDEQGEDRDGLSSADQRSAPTPAATGTP